MDYFFFIILYVVCLFIYTKGDWKFWTNIRKIEPGKVGQILSSTSDGTPKWINPDVAEK